MTVSTDRRRLLPGVLLTLALAACDNQDRPPDDPPPPPAPTVSLTVEGTLSSAGNSGSTPAVSGTVAAAAIEIVAGSRRFTGSTDADGRYSVTVTVPEASVDTLGLRIVGRRTLPSGLELRFIGELGSVARGLARAGADRVLTADEEVRVNVTPLSTAEVALLDEAAMRATAGTGTTRTAAATGSALDDDLDSRRLRLDYQQLLDAATAIALVVDRGVPLPTGVADTFALAAGQAVRQAFIEAQRRDNRAAFDAALADLLGNAAVTRPLAAADLPARLIVAVVGDVTPEALYGNGGSYRDARELRFEPDGTGRYTDSTHDSPMRWAINADGLVEVRFDSAPGSSFPATTLAPGGGTVATTCTRRLTEFDLQSIGPDAAIVRDRLVQTCSPAAPELESDTRSTRTVLAIDAARLPAFTAAEVSGTTLALGLPLDAAPPTATLFPTDDALSFSADGSGSARVSGLDFQWTVEPDGTLELVLSNGNRARYRLLRDAFTGARQAVMTATFTDGSQRTDGKLIYATNADYAFDADTVPGTYYLFGLGVEPAREFVVVDNRDVRPATLAEAALLKGTGIVLRPSGREVTVGDSLAEAADGTVSRRLSATSDIDRGNYWQVGDDGDLTIRRYRRAGGQFGTDCGFEATDPDCTVIDQREITPLFRHGERLGWLIRRGETVDANRRLVPPYDQNIAYFEQAPVDDILIPRDGAPAATP